MNWFSRVVFVKYVLSEPPNLVCFDWHDKNTSKFVGISVESADQPLVVHPCYTVLLHELVLSIGVVARVLQRLAEC